MMRFIVFLLIVLISLSFYILTSKATDWCEIQSKFCNTADNNKTLQHIGCKNNEVKNQRCSTKAELIQIDENLKKFILEYHNLKRSEIAIGEYEIFRPASRMIQMVWDNDLEMLAEMQVKTCSLQNDKCHATFKNRKPGQIISRFINSKGFNVTQIVNNTLNNLWSKGIQLITDNKCIEYFNITTDGAHQFATMIYDNNSMIGCGLMKYNDGSLVYDLTCNYAETIEMGYQLYKIGEPCSECSYGCSSEFPNLCSGLYAIKSKKRQILDWDVRPDLRDLVLEHHNMKRMEIATGKLRSFKPASRMFQLIWDKELQNLAQAYVISPSSNENGKNIGLNTFWITQNDFGIMANLKQKMSTILEKIINKWWEDGINMSPYLIDFYNSEDEVTSRLANMIFDNATRIGCGLVKHVLSQTNSMEIIFACYYEKRFKMKKPLYKIGSSCSECPYGCSNQYVYLCQQNDTEKSLI